MNALKKTFKSHRRVDRGAGFCGGAVGYYGYDGQFHFGLYDQVLAFDQIKKTVTVYAPRQESIDHIVDIMKGPAPRALQGKARTTRLGFKSNFNKTQYVRAVKQALGHIRQGDIYQVNLSRKVWVSTKLKEPRAQALAIYQTLRAYSPSPFASYFDDGENIILSSSPERFLRLAKGVAQVKPMKGTRPRGKNKAEDTRLRNELLYSAKEIAELLMVTDLERNDLGRVCSYGSVKVKTMRTIEAYRSVYQATALVEGKLHKNKDSFDLLNATFPGGSVTGCPKIEAMKIIRTIEGRSRGLYTGILGYIGFNGDMDFSVLIRTLFLDKDGISFHVGGGIVADSNPAAEYEETCVKAKAMEMALEAACFS